MVAIPSVVSITYSNFVRCPMAKFGTFLVNATRTRVSLIFILNQDNYVSDHEWAVFYRLLVEPFQTCDENKDATLDMKEF